MITLQRHIANENDQLISDLYVHVDSFYMHLFHQLWQYQAVGRIQIIWEHKYKALKGNLNW
jgi:hypothetical protein